MPPMPPVTKSLLLACVAVFCLNLFLPLEAWFALWPLTSGEFMPWQPLSYAFLHGDTLHLFFNMLGLWMFGAELEQLWGRRRFWQYLAASVLVAAAAQIVLTLATGSGVPTVGASGALYGLLLAYGMLFPHRTIMPLFPPIPMKARTFVVVFGAIELTLGFVGTGNIAHFAHLGGMLGGWLMISHWRRGGPRRRR
jgi:membrane associated rhomboid family serine protease